MAILTVDELIAEMRAGAQATQGAPPEPAAILSVDELIAEMRAGAQAPQEAPAPGPNDLTPSGPPPQSDLFQMLREYENLYPPETAPDAPPSRDNDLALLSGLLDKRPNIRLGVGTTPNQTPVPVGRIEQALAAKDQSLITDQPPLDEPNLLTQAQAPIQEAIKGLDGSFDQEKASKIVELFKRDATKQGKNPNQLLLAMKGLAPIDVAQAMIDHLSSAGKEELYEFLPELKEAGGDARKGKAIDYSKELDVPLEEIEAQIEKTGHPDEGTKREQLIADERAFYKEHPPETLELTPTGQHTKFGMPVYKDQFDGIHSESTETFEIEVQTQRGREIKWVTAGMIWKGKYRDQEYVTNLLKENDFKNPTTDEDIPLFDTREEAEKFAVDRDMELQEEGAVSFFNLPGGKLTPWNIAKGVLAAPRAAFEGFIYMATGFFGSAPGGQVVLSGLGLVGQYSRWSLL